MHDQTDWPIPDIDPPIDWMDELSAIRVPERLSDWLTDWLTDKPTYRPTSRVRPDDWLNDRLHKLNGMTGRPVVWLTDRPTNRTSNLWVSDDDLFSISVCLTTFLITWLIDLLIDRLDSFRVRDSEALERAFCVNPLYLRHHRQGDAIDFMVSWLKTTRVLKRAS